MKRAFVVASLVLCFMAPAAAVGPLASIVIGYVKQALKEKVIAYAKEQASGFIGDSLAGVPGASMLGLVPGMAGLAPRPGMPAEATAALKAAGFYDTSAKPLSDAEWDEYEQTISMMAKAGGMEDDDVPDVKRMRTMTASMPQMSGMLRMQLQQFREMKAEQARMREAYAQMPEAERQEVVAELVKNFREQPPEVQPNAMKVLESDALGLPEDLRRRLLAVLKA
ncbi:hypothetical protein SAMN06265795_12819 [Noviherbaspirillum humi]|uniref:LTXXQ motif family protein n=1 Tax=Noviherbaspirillum humi TaxID=1688639 RepID=A0A239LZZ2_9BURK|nr:hypothetical protein [Noviherbaspirillum humi]SNT35458.1 hypothetical protein SAMN06265795_12819 [Noviherbaspirillum humi]